MTSSVVSAVLPSTVTSTVWGPERTALSPETVIRPCASVEVVPGSPVKLALLVKVTLASGTSVPFEVVRVKVTSVGSCWISVAGSADSL